MSTARGLVGALAYPAIVSGAMLVTWGLGARGVAWELAVAASAVGVGLAVDPLERWIPYAPRWSEQGDDRPVDALHLVFSTLVVYAAFHAALERLPAFGLGLWPTRWPLLAQFAVAAPVAELGVWVTHWLMHTTGPLWRIHLVHHSARRLYSLNASRNHPLDTLLVLLAAAAPLRLLGAGAPVLALLGAFALAHLSLQHANIDLRLGPLNRVFAGPELHRWHHSRRPEEARCNYGHLLIVWDVVFGTRLLPDDRDPPLDVGLFDREGIPERYLHHLAAPFSDQDASPRV